jgi:hypothetical protein
MLGIVLERRTGYCSATFRVCLVEMVRGQYAAR